VEAKVTVTVNFGFCRQKTPLLSDSRYFREAVIFGEVENVCNSREMVLEKEDTYYEN